MHAGADHDLGLSGEQLDLVAGAAGAVVQLIEQLCSQWYRFGEPHGDVAAGGPPRHGMPIQHLTDLLVAVQAVDQRDGRGNGGAAAALPDRHTPWACPVRSTTWTVESSWAATSSALHLDST